MGDLLHEMIEWGKKGGRKTQRTQQIPEVLCAGYDHPDKQTAIQQHTNRFVSE